MKKILYSLLLLVVAVSCAEPPKNEVVPAN